MQPSTRLRWSLDPALPGARLEGEIDEFSDLPRLASSLTGPRAALDLAGVRRINSLGVRQWMQLMLALEGKSLELVRCPPALVEQLNAIRGFSGSARVKSVLLPYSCETCGTLVLTEMELGGFQPGGALPADPACTACGKATVFDDLPERYLGFVQFIRR